jgi:hypothetical protein
MKKRTIAQTPAPNKDKIKGSSINKVDSAKKENSSSIILSNTTIKVLQDKLKEFKDKHPNNKSITLNDLKAVYRRGSGAYSTSHRPNITRAGWSYARVNKFLEKASGNKVKKAYVQDDDLLKYQQGGILDESELQINKANELRDALVKEGFKVSNPIHSKTNFGRSTYLYLLDEDGNHNEAKKLRISDHNTGAERFWNEYHYTQKSNVNDIIDWVKSDIVKAENKYKERLEKELPEKIRRENAYKYWDTIKHQFDDYEFKIVDKTYQNLEEFKNAKPKFGIIPLKRTNIYQKKLVKGRNGEQAFSYEFTIPKKEGYIYYGKNLPSVDWIEWYRSNIENKFKRGGKVKTYWYTGLFN